jgi:hypothetical protein
MKRGTLSLVLALLLLVPPRVVLGFVPMLAPASADLPAAKVCPCTGNVICKCGSCCSDSPDADGDDGAETDHSANDRSGFVRMIHCRGTTADPLLANPVFLPSARPTQRTLQEPAPTDLCVGLSGFWYSLSLPVDSPPPKR